MIRKFALAWLLLAAPANAADLAVGALPASVGGGGGPTASTGAAALPIPGLRSGPVRSAASRRAEPLPATSRTAGPNPLLGPDAPAPDAAYDSPRRPLNRLVFRF